MIPGCTENKKLAIIMVGDNPRTDILGASTTNLLASMRNATARWGSITVRTGVYQRGMPTYDTLSVSDHALAATEWILSNRNDILPFLDREHASREVRDLAEATQNITEQDWDDVFVFTSDELF